MMNILSNSKIIVISFLFLILSCNQESNNSFRKENAKNEIQDSTPKLYWHWEEQFSPSEKSKIKNYITKVTEATFKILGKYPFDVHYYFHRSDSKNEPIPWAHTERKKNKQGVRFYINPEFDEEIFFNDWTAPHEISHLSIPFLGRENSWFSEGYASYMQYQIMHEMGIYTKREVAEKYKIRIEKIRSDYDEQIPFIENANKLRAQYNYPAMYWGGAQFFIYMDSILIKHEEMSFNSLIKECQRCCRIEGENIKQLLKSWDKKLKYPGFVKLFDSCNIKSFDEIYIN